MGSGLLQRLYATLVEEEDDRGTGEVEPGLVEAVPGNAVRIISALTLQKVGDRLADPKTVLAWLVATLGAPALFTGLLVPVRESGSLLPQAFLVPWVTRQPLRKRVWMAGGVGQSLAVAGMAGVAAGLRGVAAGLALVACLAVFALSRSLSSIAYKDVLGRTIPKGERGQVSGLASVTSGVVAITFGLGLRFLGQDAGAGVLAVALVVAALLWGVAVLVFWQVQEEPPDAADRDPAPEQPARSEEDGGLAGAWRLLVSDQPFRRFVITRSLLLVSALSPPFVVSLSGSSGSSGDGAGAALSGLGGFVVAQGVASMVGGRFWGGQADASSRTTMVRAAAAASVVVVAYLVLGGLIAGSQVVALLAYFLLALAHEGARLGRKTYVTDMAEGDQRTSYVAASNSAMGIILLLAGGLSAGLAVIGPEAALAFLAVAGLAGAVTGRTLPEVSVSRS